MGTLSPEDEKTLLWTCGTILLVIGILLGCIGYAIYMLAQWVFG